MVWKETFDYNDSKKYFTIDFFSTKNLDELMSLSKTDATTVTLMTINIIAKALAWKESSMASQWNLVQKLSLERNHLWLASET